MSTVEKKCRLRGPNFTNSDSLLLCDIISKHKNIIENKKTDGVNLLQKQKAWMEIVIEFNATTTGHTRTVESLQQNYKNLKKKAKKNASCAKMDIPVDGTVLVQHIEEYGTSSEGWEKVSESVGASKENCQNLFNVLSKEAETKEKYLKKSIMGTGGGPPPKCDDDPILSKIKGLVGPSMDGFYTIYDGDSDIMAQQNIPPIELKNLSVDEGSVFNTETSINEDEKLTQDQSIIVTPKTHMMTESFFTNNRANLKRKPHELLSRKRKLESPVAEKQSVSDKFKALASDKMELINMQKEVLKLQLTEEQEKLEHNRLLRSLEIENAKAMYAHQKELRKLEIEKYMSMLNKET